jgi:hypothetical protein
MTIYAASRLLKFSPSSINLLFVPYDTPLRHFATFTDFSTRFYEYIYKDEIQIKLRICWTPTSEQ